MHTLDQEGHEAAVTAAGRLSGTRVLHVITGMGLGGAERVVAQLASAGGSSAAVAWLTGSNHWENGLAAAEVDCRFLGVRGLRNLPSAISRLGRFIRQFEPDVVHTHLLHANLVGRLAARRAGSLRVISTEHGLRMYSHPRHRWLDRLDVRTSQHNRAVAAVSVAVRNRCKQAGYRPDTLHVVYNGVDLPQHKCQAPGGRDSSLVSMIGRLNWEKGADTFVRAAELIEGSSFCLVGDGRERTRIERMMRSSEVSGRLRWLPQADVDAVICASDVVVVPSRSEGLGLVALEAMARCRPVVATAVGGLEEVVEDGVTGLLVEPERPEAIASAVNTLLADSSRRRCMGAAGRARVAARFSLAEMLSQYDELYRSEHAA